VVLHPVTKRAKEGLTTTVDGIDPVLC
jgi:hypothetical protein